MLVINSYSSVRLLPAKPATEGKKAPPRRIVVDGNTFVTVWASDLPALKGIVAKREPIPVTPRARAFTPEGADEPVALVDLTFAGGLSLEDETQGESLV